MRSGVISADVLQRLYRLLYLPDERIYIIAHQKLMLQKGTLLRCSLFFFSLILMAEDDYGISLTTDTDPAVLLSHRSNCLHLCFFVTESGLTVCLSVTELDPVVLHCSKHQQWQQLCPNSWNCQRL